MQEYSTDAIVLSKSPRGDADGRYSLFTRKFGKIVARAISSRKIVSKLAGHLEPGTISSVRVIEQNGVNIVDALKVRARNDIPLVTLASLDQLMGEWEPDEALWRELTQNDFSWARALAALGWDPAGAACALCATAPARNFSIRRQEFFCASCASKARRNELLLIDNA